MNIFRAGGGWEYNSWFQTWKRVCKICGYTEYKGGLSPFAGHPFEREIPIGTLVKCKSCGKTFRYGLDDKGCDCMFKEGKQPHELNLEIVKAD